MPATNRSPSPSSSRSSSPPLQLDPSTLAALSSFYDEQAEAERQFAELEKKAHDRLVQAQEGQADGAEEQRTMSVDEFRKLFGEDWQLSQFWYSADFATRFSRFLYSFCTPTTRIAFLSCPTAYIGFQHENPLKDAWLWEYDTRFKLVAGDKFVHYDLEEPERYPQELRGTVDIAIADPPFLNEVTNRYFATTLRSLLKPDGKLILLTSTSVSSILPKVYDSPPVGPLRKTSLQVEHAGGRLQNDFGGWSNFDFDEREGVKSLEQL
ncbi:Protein-lysine N-methyltransferase EFM5 [Rhodotorula toruloides]|nr:Protein-lysine N-methyltransferase EFM5 [Rhodotorula toruloides]